VQSERTRAGPRTGTGGRARTGRTTPAGPCPGRNTAATAAGSLRPRHLQIWKRPGTNLLIGPGRFPIYGRQNNSSFRRNWPMKSACLGVLVAAAVALLLVSCNKSPNENQAQQSAPATTAETGPVPPAPPAAPPPVPPATELPISTVDSVMLSRPQDAPEAMIIRVLGTASSPGWTEPKLEAMSDTGGDASIKSYQFVATSPETPDAGTAMQPIETELRVDALPPEVKTIRIVSATNEVSAPVAQ